eukprot:CAMPEP_0117581476 /NCGR_PEP_ID=MMETSP0784-20121206/65847_1 /TAXON_ID=39447 /ORGANISM="" /LENGTH=128 /DNA_ID=CAMNT_0005381789 /DNA_START=45 /DNA_END=431 /DNA_ORIENTATION=-
MSDEKPWAPSTASLEEKRASLKAVETNEKTDMLLEIGRKRSSLKSVETTERPEMLLEIGRTRSSLKQAETREAISPGETSDDVKAALTKLWDDCKGDAAEITKKMDWQKGPEPGISKEDFLRKAWQYA